MAQSKRKTDKPAVKAAAPPEGEKHASAFEKEMAERVAALIAAGRMPAFEDVLRAVKKFRDTELEGSPTQDTEHE